MQLPIAIVGFGISGKAVRRLLKLRGIPDGEIATLDAKPRVADFTDPQKLLSDRKYQTIIVSPGYPLSTPWIQEFKARGGTITSELALAAEHLSTETVIGITGSLGKSTVTALVGEGLKAAAVRCFVGGNLGLPLAEYACDQLAGSIEPVDCVVLELSSYQLENAGALHCQASAITYLSPNHLDRYSSLEAYYACKWTIAERTRGLIYLNRNGGDLKSFVSGLSLKPEMEQSLRWVEGATSKDFHESELASARLLGLHNRDNLALAAALVKSVKVEDFRAAKVGMLNFPGLPHRLQDLGTFQGVRFLDDSKATTIDSVVTAVQSLTPTWNGIIHVLIGGRDKNLPWGELRRLGPSQNLRFHFFGEARARIAVDSGLAGTEWVRLEEAVAGIKNIINSGDLVLLSPGGTSLDEFSNFEERGKMFYAYVRKYFVD